MTLKKLLIFLSCLAFLATKPAKSIAWGAQGHRLIVETALSLLSPDAKTRVMQALNGYSTDLAAVWMDSVRIHHVPKYAYMKNWHFLDMNADQVYSQVANKNDVVYNLQRVVDVFNSGQQLSADSLKMNLKILFHLMGDITQPLHCGYGFDVGGNSVLVATAKFNVTGNNLHHVWDDIIIEEGKINLQTCQAYIQGMTVAKKQLVTQGTAQDWMLQSRSYLVNAYAFNQVQNGTTALSLQYLDNNVPIVQQQLAFAALRLANVLERAFGR
jgi:hypothetical protein